MPAQASRIALATAVFALGLLIGGKTKAGGITLQTPAGSLPGDTFRFAFVTDGLTTAESSSISDYNNFVNTQAGGATYDGQSVSWDAIASTSSVNAIDNIGQVPIAGVYLADGTLITSSTSSSGLWSGHLLHAINEDLAGVNMNQIVWTGTVQSGLKDSSFYLGATTGRTGFSGTNGTQWINEGIDDAGNSNQMYGISQVLSNRVELNA
jgi:hypothetical protein